MSRHRVVCLRNLRLGGNEIVDMRQFRMENGTPLYTRRGFSILRSNLPAFLTKLQSLNGKPEFIEAEEVNLNPLTHISLDQAVVMDMQEVYVDA